MGAGEAPHVRSVNLTLLDGGIWVEVGNQYSTLNNVLYGQDFMDRVGAMTEDILGRTQIRIYGLFGSHNRRKSYLITEVNRVWSDALCS